MPEQEMHNTHKLVIRGRVPSKKNSRIVFVRGGKMVNIPSKAYVTWHKDATDQLTKQAIPSETIQKASLIQLFFYAPDKRGTDLTNKAESIMDLLVDNGILIDDNWWVVGDLSLKFRGIDRANPRCEVYIHNESK